VADITYYFNSKSTSNWTDSGYMIDNILTNYATETGDGVIETLNGNTCDGADLGTIIKVEIRAYGYGDVDDRIDLTPIFGGGDGDEHQTTPGSSPDWGSYVDVTSDTNHPSPWTWGAVQSLGCKVEFNKVAKGNTMHCAKVEVRVTYTTADPPTVTTQDCDQVDALQARGNGNITDTGGETVTRRGFCYMEGTSGDPTTSNSVAYDDGEFGTGAYTKVITGLSPNTNYRVRAYAINLAGLGYGITVQLTTDAIGAPTGFSSPSQTETTIGLSWTKGEHSDKTLVRFRDDQYPTGVADGNEAYFDTGEATTVEGTDAVISQPNGVYDTSLYDGVRIRAAQRIDSFPARTITRVSFKVKKYGSPAGTAYVRIRKVSDDSIISTIAEVDVSTLTTLYEWQHYDCEVSNPTQQDLRFSYEWGGGDINNKVDLHRVTTGGIENACHSQYLTSWEDTSHDLAIEVHYLEPLEPATTYYFRAWGYQSSVDAYSETTADLTQATSGGAPPEGVLQQAMHLMRMRRA